MQVELNRVAFLLLDNICDHLFNLTEYGFRKFIYTTTSPHTMYVIRMIWKPLSLTLPNTFLLVSWNTCIFFSSNIGSVNTRVWLGSLCLTSLSTIFQWHRGGQIYWQRKQEKTTDLLHVTDNLYHIMLYRVHLPWAELELKTLVHWLHR